MFLPTKFRPKSFILYGNIISAFPLPYFFLGKPCISHYSYDFAQQVHFPFSAQQTWPECFKTARKCGIFGVGNDGENKQVTYLIDEAECEHLLQDQLVPWTLAQVVVPWQIC